MFAVVVNVGVPEVPQLNAEFHEIVRDPVPSWIICTEYVMPALMFVGALIVQPEAVRVILALYPAETSQATALASALRVCGAAESASDPGVTTTLVDVPACTFAADAVDSRVVESVPEEIFEAFVVSVVALAARPETLLAAGCANVGLPEVSMPVWN